jgi:hypothetical protein
MTPQEINLMKEMLRAALREEIPVALEPLQKELESVRSKVGGLETSARVSKEEIQKLKDVDRRHSGGVKAVREELPRMQSLTQEQIAVKVAEESGKRIGATVAIEERLEGLEREISDYRREALERAEATSFKVPDREGGVSLIPAAMVAAQSSQRNEGVTRAIAVDTEAAAAGVRVGNQWNKAIASGLVLVPILVEVIKHVAAAILKQ